jgi:hypothetical protein
MQHLWNLAPFLSVKWYQVFGEVCCPHPDFILRKVTVVKIERIISSFATDRHRHQRINRRFPHNWNILLLRRHWIPFYLAVPPFIVRRSTKCYLQLKFLVPLRNSATCNNCCTLSYWPTHWLASLLRLFQIFFPSSLFHIYVLLTIELIQREDFSIQILWLLSNKSIDYKKNACSPKSVPRFFIRSLS